MNGRHVSFFIDYSDVHVRVKTPSLLSHFSLCLKKQERDNEQGSENHLTCVS